MELYCEIGQGIRPGILDRLTGFTIADETILTVKIYLTEPRTRKLVSNIELARVFGYLIQTIAEGKAIGFCFPYDLKEIKKALARLNLAPDQEKKVLRVQVPSEYFPTLTQLLESCAFTTFYGWVNGVNALYSSLETIIEGLDSNRFAIVLTLYDDSVELLTRTIPRETIKSLLNDVGIRTGVQVLWT